MMPFKWILVVLALSASLTAQNQPSVDWASVQAETMRHYQALLRLDTTAGNESLAATYLQQVLEREGIPEHFQEIDAEYCLAETGTTIRSGGKVQFTQVQTAEKVPYNTEVTATGTSGHGSVPLLDNPVVHLSAALAALGTWKPPIRLTETTREYFTRLATLALPQDAARYRAVLNPESKVAQDAVDYFADSP